MSKLPENPYMDGHRAFLEQHGSIVQAAHQWRMATLGLIVLLIILGGGFVAVSLQHKVVPFFVEFNEHSEPVRVTRASEMTQPSGDHIKAALGNWIIGARSVWGDRRAQEHMINTTYAMTMPDSSAYQSLALFHKDNNPFDRSQKEAVEVAVNSVQLVGGDSWSVDWTETTKQPSGRLISTIVMKGTFAVAIVPPADEMQIMKNAAGVYVHRFNWSNRT